MIIASTSPDRSGLALAALLVCCLPTLVFSDEIQYLPDNPQIIASIDFETSTKTKAYQEAMRLLPQQKPYRLEDPLHLGFAKIARITGAWYMSKEVGPVEQEEVSPVTQFLVFTTIKPINVAELEALNKPSPFWKNFAYKEIKVGSILAYQENLLKVRGGLSLRQVVPFPSEAEYEKIFTAAQTMVNAMQVFSADNKVSASAELEPALAMRGIYGFFGIARNERR